jgi:5'(3')-deoxyribonucleotidase
MEDKKIIKIDVDGVLRDMLSTMCNLYNIEYKDNIQPSDVKNYDVDISFPKCKEVDGMSAKYFFFSEKGFELARYSSIVPKAKEAMDILHNLGYYIVIVSYQDGCYNQKNTLYWLDEHNIYYDSICFTDDKSIIKGDIMVDDCIDFLKQCDNNEEELICVKAPYNENDNFFTKVPSLYHYARFLETQEGKEYLDNLKK